MMKNNLWKSYIKDLYRDKILCKIIMLARKFYGGSQDKEEIIEYYKALQTLDISKCDNKTKKIIKRALYNCEYRLGRNIGLKYKIKTALRFPGMFIKVLFLKKR